MKRLLFIFVAIAFCSNFIANAQISFLGVPIDGNPSSFSKKMSAKGFVISNKEPNIIYMKGKYWNENVYICIESTPISNIVYDVTVLFTPNNSWQTLYAKYKSCIQKVTKLYGNPGAEDEYFDYPYNSDSQFVKMTGVEQEACHYWKNYFVEGGYIMVLIHPSKRVTISYCNEENELKCKQEE